MPDRLQLSCGCTARVNAITRTREIDVRHEDCAEPRHDPGGRVWLWEQLVDPRQVSALEGRDWRLAEPVI